MLVGKARLVFVWQNAAENRITYGSSSASQFRRPIPGGGLCAGAGADNRTGGAVGLVLMRRYCSGWPLQLLNEHKL
jgi:hypothetical protein